ncbi:MAG: ComF family protein, partial [Gammaproteobacteria bacterium]
IEGRDHDNICMVPVPMASSRGRLSGLTRLVRGLGERLGITVVEAVERKKSGSTRGSVAQKRDRIVQEEYSIVASRLPEVAGREVLLIDDVITTGHTISGVARLLLSAGAAAVLPIALDRTASQRLLQRLASVAPDHCPHR